VRSAAEGASLCGFLFFSQWKTIEPQRTHIVPMSFGKERQYFIFVFLRGLRG
jgi:hypothetical protein